MCIAFELHSLNIFKMWRFFRLGIKGSNCPGNQTHFRIIGTTCANAECDDKVEECNDSVLNIENYEAGLDKNLAHKAAAEHLSFLRRKSNYYENKTPFNYEPNKLKDIDSSLKQIQWEQYSKQKKKVFLENDKNGIDVSKKEREEKSSKPQKVVERFGMLSENPRKFEELPEEKDDKENHPLKGTYAKRLYPNDYGRKILALCREQKLKDALEVLEVEMKAQQVIPNSYCYNILINACGKVGYTKKAFELYHQMKRHGINVEKFAYTGLFNACANSPYNSTEGLKLAGNLKQQLQNKEILLHPITYHAMIKAFGRCGDIETAFGVVDEMLELKHNVTTETMNFLLQACISDKENGFRHALMVWRQMRDLKIPPCIFSYNLLMRCTKECSGGDPRLASELLKMPKSVRQSARVGESSVGKRHRKALAQRGETNSQRTPESARSVSQKPPENDVVRVDLSENMEMEIINRDVSPPAELKEREISLPRVLSRKFHPGNVVDISSLEKREDRLFVLGGPSGVLESMGEDRVRPTIATFSLILESLPRDVQAEEALLLSMEKCKVVPDVIFCNELIRKRAMRGEHRAAQDVLDLMQKHRLALDLITFGCLAISCRRPSVIKGFLKDMDRIGFTPNREIMSTLIRNTLTCREYAYAIELLRKMTELGLDPSEQDLGVLEQARKTIRQRIISKEIEGNKECLSSAEMRKREEMKLFLIEYSHWLKKSKLELKDHPWAQFGYEQESESQVAVWHS